MDCKNCPEKKKADYWYRVTTTILTIIGGVCGGIVGALIVRLFGN